MIRVADGGGLGAGLVWGEAAIHVAGAVHPLGHRQTTNYLVRIEQMVVGPIEEPGNGRPQEGLWGGGSEGLAPFPAKPENILHRATLGKIGVVIVRPELDFDAHRFSDERSEVGTFGLGISSVGQKR